MYFNILKKDLKRKKTMNIIVLLFMILAAMFVSSSVNNIVAVFGGLDSYFNKADMSDYFVITLDHGDPSETEKVLDNIEEVDSYGYESMVMVTSDNIDVDGSNSSIVFPFESSQINYFDKDNNIITEVKAGTIWVAIKALMKSDYNVGDKITLTSGEYSEEFEIAGGFKDALFGSDMMGNTRFILAEEDYKIFAADEESKTMAGSIFYIDTDDTDAVAGAVSEINLAFNGPASTIKMTYVMDMLIAGVMLIVSVLLIITAFIVLRFTIGFTISEEFREIGVMKAIGIRNYKIRTLYIVKYLGLAVVGSAIGFFASIPFGKMLLNSVTKTMVLESEDSILINLICSIVVVAVILLFCYSCTRKIVKSTPLDAIRSGQTGERYRKKCLIRLSRSRLNTTGFLALNDVLSSPKRYALITVIIILVLSPVLIMADSANTLQSEKLVPVFGMTVSDAYISDGDSSYFKEGGEEIFKELIKEREKKLADNGMPAEITSEIMLKLSVTHGDKTFKSQVLQGQGTTTDEYKYIEGTAPQNADEIAVTPLVAESIGAEIGDTVTMKFMEGDRDFIITAIFQTMNNMGEGVRLHESVKYSYAQIAGNMAFQVNFTDNPNQKEIDSRIERMKDIFDNDEIYNSSEFVKDMTGMADTIESIKYLILALAVIVTALVAILMERSFIEKERGEISLRKAIGFRNGTIISHHVLRMGIAAFIAAAVSAIISTPVTNLIITPVFGIMGAVSIDFEINPLEVFVIYPVIIIAAMVLFTFISAQYTRKITTSEVSGIE